MEDFVHAVNNAGVDSIKKGDLQTAMDIFSVTCSPECQEPLVDRMVDVGSCVWGLEWVDCSESACNTSFLRGVQKSEMEAFVFQRALKLVQRTTVVGGVPFSSSSSSSSRTFLSSSSWDWTRGEFHDFVLGKALTPSCAERHKEAVSPQDSSTWVFVYNYALANHLFGMQLGEKGFGLLRQAHFLYEMAESLIHIESSHQDRPLVLMAIHNNQACIYYQIGLYQETLTSLASLAADLLLSSRDDDTTTTGSDWNGFFLNVTILRQPRLAPAA